MPLHMLNIYHFLQFIKKRGIPTVITQHAEFLYTGSYTHVPDGSFQWLDGKKEGFPYARKLTNSWFFDKTEESLKKFVRVFADFNNLVVVSVSPWLKRRSMQSLVFRNHENVCVMNGINTNIFKRTVDRDMYQIYRPNNEKIILHVTSGFSNKIKGSKHLLEIGNLMKNDNYKVLLIGVDQKDTALPDNFICLGKILDQRTLSKFYSIADVTLLTSKKETFSMVVAESLCCGTPVVGFKAGGPESISIDEFSDFVEYGDIQAAVYEIRKWCHYAKLDREYISKMACEKYSVENMGEKYLSIYQKLIKSVH